MSTSHQRPPEQRHRAVTSVRVPLVTDIGLLVLTPWPGLSPVWTTLTGQRCPCGGLNGAMRGAGRGWGWARLRAVGPFASLTDLPGVRASRTPQVASSHAEPVAPGRRKAQRSEPPGHGPQDTFRRRCRAYLPARQAAGAQAGPAFQKAVCLQPPHFRQRQAAPTQGGSHSPPQASGPGLGQGAGTCEGLTALWLT